MALIAEEVVEEWLNQKGYFTIRGIKLGVQEIDILAIKPSTNGLDLRHYEVQASANPVSYISAVPKAIQKETGRAANSRKDRTSEEIELGVTEWIAKKFLHSKKVRLRNDLVKGDWSYHFVVHRVAHDHELEEFAKREIEVVRFDDVLSELREKADRPFTATGRDLVELILMNS